MTLHKALTLHQIQSYGRLGPYPEHTSKLRGEVRVLTNSYFHLLLLSLCTWQTLHTRVLTIMFLCIPAFLSGVKVRMTCGQGYGLARREPTTKLPTVFRKTMLN